MTAFGHFALSFKTPDSVVGVHLIPDIRTGIADDGRIVIQAPKAERVA